MPLSINLQSRVVLVTGVSSGIGLGVSRLFARSGAIVAGCARKADDSDEAKTFMNTIAEEGSEGMYVCCDVTSTDELEHFVNAVTERYGRIDVLVSNAGVNIFEGAGECSEERWQYCMNLNLAAHWHLARMCQPWLEKSGKGVVLIMTSNHGYYTIPGCFPYNVAKTALRAVAQSMAIEWGPKIRAVAVAPGFIDTAGNDTWFNSFADPAAERQRTVDMHPVKCLGTVDEVGALCVYLASDYARFISGTTVLMDGGRSALMQD